MDPTLFKNSVSGRIIKVGQGDLAYWAFLPNALPPILASDWDLTRALSEADRNVSELAGLGRMLPNPNLVIGPFLRREAVLSSKIEGTHSDITDLYMYESGQFALPGLEPVMPEDEDVHEVFNYLRALETGLSQLTERQVDLWVIRGLHKILLDGVRGQYATPGEFRTQQNWIGGETINQAVYVPPPVIELDPALYNLAQYFYKDDYPPLIRLAIIHYQFEAIHPFVDGNGRMGRLLLSILLVNWKILPLPLLHLSAYFESHRQEYYDLLLRISQTGEWRDWILFFLRAITTQSQDTCIRIKRIQDLQQNWHQQLIEVRAAHSAFQLADYLFENPIITIPITQKILGMSHRGAKLVVQKLTDLDIINPISASGHLQKFIAKDIFTAILR